MAILTSIVKREKKILKTSKMVKMTLLKMRVKNPHMLVSKQTKEANIERS